MHRGSELRLLRLNEKRRIVASVPDLIAVLDAGTGRAVGVPEYRYEVHAILLGITCSSLWLKNRLALSDSAN
jgi:DUF917 family protein